MKSLVTSSSSSLTSSPSSSEGKLTAENAFFGYVGGNENTRGNYDRSDARRDKIAENMQEDYQRVLEERGMDEIDENSQDIYDEEDEDY